MTLAELSRNTAFRLAAMFVSLYSGAMIVAFLIAYWQAGNLLDRHLLDRLSETRDALLVVATRDGFEGLRGVVQSEAAAIRTSDTILRLLDKSGATVAGNAASVEIFQGVRRIPRASIPEMAGRASYEDSFVARWIDVAGGKLLVGVSDRDEQATRDSILAGLGLGIISVLGVAGLAGIWLANRAQSHIDAFGKTLEAVSHGKLDRRVPMTGRGDDLDQVAERLNSALDRLSRLIERVNQSSSAIAHELKSPIGRLRQRLERLPYSGSTQTSEEIVGAALAEIDRVVEIIDAVLRISQIQAGARRNRFTPIDLAELVEEVAEVYEPVAEEAGLALVCQPPMTNGRILGDPQLLRQLFVNLIENAMRHSGGGRTITLSLDQDHGDPVAVVADDGAGIPEEERQRVLEPFARLDASRSTPGAGLGLSLVAAIAELHGARLVLGDNAPGLSVRMHFRRQK
ncbi:MAG: HAMP domain-containing sensor histidine kinase [Hyphomicrobiaceae bacterium]